MESNRIKMLSKPPAHHFFGYYGMNAWDASLQHHLALETTFHEHRPTARDRARVGLVDAATGTFYAYGETPAFNLQQGSMLHWIEAGHGPEFTYNDWTGERLVSRAINPTTDARRTLDGAIAAMSPVAPLAAGLDYVRMSKCRPVVGYDLQPNAPLDVLYPEDDGIFAVDLGTGERSLPLSLAEVVRGRPDEQTRDGAAWFNHVLFRPDGHRLLFMCRIRRSERFWDSLWTVNLDGSDLRCLLDYRFRTSHFAWMDNRHILCSTNVLGEMQFVRLTDGSDEIEPFGNGLLPPDGHACYSPDGRWIACDSYPSGAGRNATLLLYHPEENRRIVLGQFHHDGQFVGDIRCDLHPRWRPDGLAVTFDSVHEGSRQVYVADVSDLVR